MRRTLGAIALAAAALVAVLTAPASGGVVTTAPAALAARPSAPLRLMSSVRLSARLFDLTFVTGALPKPTHVRVLLPTGYGADRARRYPVVYMLHGAADGYTSWARPGGGDAVQATAALPLIAVMPDGGQGGFYTDWVAPGLDGQPQWETYHIDELIPWIDAHYRTIAARDGRAILGLSMGGFGALSYAAKHPDLFVAAASFSGAVDLNTPPYAAAHAVDLIAGLDGGLPGSLFGLRETDEVRWRGANPWDLAMNLRGMSVTIRTGDGDTGGAYGGGGPTDGRSYLEYLVYPMNVSLEQRLHQLGIPNMYDAYVGGTHSWPYWNGDLAATLPTFMAVFAHPPKMTTFDYTSIQPTYSVWGWTVAITRAATEFSTLTGAGPAGFTLAGSGTAVVTTAASYAPGSLHHVTVGGASTPLRADAGGRLAIRVPLGPPNLAQEIYLPLTATPVATRTYTTAVRIS